MAESTVGWFGVREKYGSLADKPWLIGQIRASEQAEVLLLALLAFGISSICMYASISL